MSGKVINRGVMELLHLSTQEAKERLPLTLNEIRDYGIGKLLEEVPDILSKIIWKLIEVDAAKVFSKVPEVSDMFMDLLWEGVSGLAAKSEEMRRMLAKMRGMKVNLEASDSGLRGHFIVIQGKLSGGSGLVHFKEQDVRFGVPTELVLRLLTGELALGFSNPSLLKEGHPGLIPLLSPIVKSISDLIKGKQ